ncbi:MAG TPA: Fe-S cluster assembly protein SufD [Salinivirgaceae bacterium]|nr:Fe-S cluster assembly protein SufD [Salinivirgaceae bacterium]
MENNRFIEKLLAKAKEETPASNHYKFLKNNAITYLKDNGHPTQRHEDWLYTKLDTVFEVDWNLSPTTLSKISNIDEIFRCDVPDLDTYRIFLFNGYLYPEYLPLPEGITIYSIKDLWQKNPTLLERYFFSIAPLNHPFNAINAAMLTDGYFLHIKKGARADKPIQLINASIGHVPFLINQHNIILAEEGSEAQIIGCDHTLSPTKFFNNNITEIHLESNASLEYYSSQNTHNENNLFSSIYVEQLSHSRFYSNIITLHGGMIRNELHVNLNQSGTECSAYGLNLTDRKQHAESFTKIHHRAPACKSFQYYKGIFDDDATGAFTGKIYVDKEAQKTEAYQSNKNLLLTPTTKVNSRPQLEIYADDVKCSHGATTGQLDTNALFYMQARGIDRKEARMLLMYAFANEIVSKIKIQPLSHRIESLVNHRLRGELSRCANCVIKCE